MQQHVVASKELLAACAAPELDLSSASQLFRLLSLSVQLATSSGTQLNVTNNNVSEDTEPVDKQVLRALVARALSYDPQRVQDVLSLYALAAAKAGADAAQPAGALRTANGAAQSEDRSECLPQVTPRFVLFYLVPKASCVHTLVLNRAVSVVINLTGPSRSVFRQWRPRRSAAAMARGLKAAAAGAGRRRAHRSTGRRGSSGRRRVARRMA